MGAPHFSGNPPGMQAYLLRFYDSIASYYQYYSPSAILGFEKVSSTQFKIYVQGAKDVNAKDSLLITHSVSLVYKNAVEFIIDIISKQALHQTTDKFITIVGATAAQSLRPELTAVAITYGVCCTSGMSTWTLTDGSTTQIINDGETVTTADSTYVNNVVSATNTITTSLSAVDGTSVAATRFLSKDNTWDVVPPFLCKTTTSFTWDSATSATFCVPFGGGTDAVTFASNQLTDDNVRDCVLYDPLGKIQVLRIYGFIESAASNGSLQIKEGQFSISTSYTGTQTFSMGSVLLTASQSAANTWYPFSIPSGFLAAGTGVMRALQLIERASPTRVYKGQITYEYKIIYA